MYIYITWLLICSFLSLFPFGISCVKQEVSLSFLLPTNYPVVSMVFFFFCFHKLSDLAVKIKQ